jgi:MYXO-CTERM domain-containing protein
LRNLLPLSLAAALALPASVHAHGDAPSFDATLVGFWPSPTLVEVEEALDAAAAEFDVPLEILQGLAHQESRWQHVPYRLAHDGRRGLFQMSPERLSTAASLLGLPAAQVQGSVLQHARGFAALLDEARPVAKAEAAAGVGAWREAIAWAMDWEPTMADQAVDKLFALLDEGLITRLADGQPVAISPVAIEPEYLGLFAASVGGRSTDYGPALTDFTSCNFTGDNRGSGDINFVIIHTVQGSYSGAISWFHNCNASVSAHYVVNSEDGEITQVVDEQDIAWHAGYWSYNQQSVGIEHEGYVDEPETWYTDEMYAASAALTADICASYGIPADRAHIIGHYEVPGCAYSGGGNSCHVDPGSSSWDWDYYMSLVTGGAVEDATELVGFIRHTDLYNADYGIAGATVSIAGVGSATADGSGFYEFPDITAGTYDVCAVAPGYQQACMSKTVEAGLTNWRSIVLTAEPASGDDDDDAEEPTPSGDDDSTEEPASGDDDAADDDAAGDDDGNPEEEGLQGDGVASVDAVRLPMRGEDQGGAAACRSNVAADGGAGSGLAAVLGAAGLFGLGARRRRGVR